MVFNWLLCTVQCTVHTMFDTYLTSSVCWQICMLVVGAYNLFRYVFCIHYIFILQCHVRQGIYIYIYILIVVKLNEKKIPLDRNDEFMLEL